MTTAGDIPQTEPQTEPGFMQKAINPKPPIYAHDQGREPGKQE